MNVYRVEWTTQVGNDGSAIVTGKDEQDAVTGFIARNEHRRVMGIDLTKPVTATFISAAGDPNWINNSGF